MEPSGASDKRVSVLECGQSSAAFASWRVPSLRKIPFAIRAFRNSPTEDVALGVGARHSQAHCQSGRGLPALQDAGATAEPLPTFRALPSSSDPNWSLLQPTRSLSHNGLALKARSIPPEIWNALSALNALFFEILGRCCRLVWGWAVGPEMRQAMPGSRPTITLALWRG